MVKFNSAIAYNKIKLKKKIYKPIMTNSILFLENVFKNGKDDFSNKDLSHSNHHNENLQNADF